MPDVIYRNFKKAPAFRGWQRPFSIYSQDEADELAIDYVTPWYIGKPGDWVLTTDYFVMQVVSRSKMKPSSGCPRGGEKIVFTGAAVMFDSKYATRAKLEWNSRRELDKHGRVDYNSHRVETYMQRFMRSKAYALAVDLYVNLWIARRGKLTRKDKENIGRMASPHDKKPYLRTKWMMKRKVIQEDVMRRLAETLQGMDINYEEVVNIVRDAIKVAKEEGSAAQMLHGADFMYKMLAATESPGTGGKHTDNRDLDDASWGYAEELEEYKEDAMITMRNDYEEQENPALGIKLDE